MTVAGVEPGRAPTDLAQTTSPSPPTQHPHRALLRLGAVSSGLGLVVSAVTIPFHGGAQPWDLPATLPEYAANPNWELVHLGQFVADVLVLVGFIALYRSLTVNTAGLSPTLAHVGIIVAVVAEAIYGVNQAVDGIAIKFVAQQWVSASAAEQASALRLADAVRHLEIGTSSLWTLTGGLALLLFGFAIALGRVYPKPLGWAAIGLGILQLATAFDLARHGFTASPLAFAGVLIAPWTVWLAVLLWRAAGRAAPADDEHASASSLTAQGGSGLGG